MPTCALIHAVEQAIEPAHAAFRSLWPEAEVFDVADLSLPDDLAEAGSLTPAFTDRMRRLAIEALTHGADGMLYTCSAFGRAITEVRSEIEVPVLKPEEAMIEAALDRGGRIVVLATFKPTLASIEREFAAAAQARGEAPPELDLRHVADASKALKQGDQARHDQLIADAAEEARDADALLLAQFTMAHVAGAIPERPGRTVLTSPAAAVNKLKSLLA